MASLRIPANAVNGDLLSDQDIRNVEAASAVNLWASCVTNGDKIGLRLDKTIIMDDGEMNIESAADVIDTNRDQLVFNSVVGRGRLRMPIPAVTTEVQALISVEPLL